MDTRVCEMCLDAAAEEALASPDEYELLCVTLGSEIADHLCEEIENEGYTRCKCACHPSEKRDLRDAVVATGGAR